MHHAVSLSPSLSQNRGGREPETLIFELRGGGFFFTVVVEGLLAGRYSGSDEL